MSCGLEEVSLFPSKVFNPQLGQICTLMVAAGSLQTVLPIPNSVAYTKPHVHTTIRNSDLMQALHQVHHGCPCWGVPSTCTGCASRQATFTELRPSWQSATALWWGSGLARTGRLFCVVMMRSGICCLVMSLMAGLRVSSMRPEHGVNEEVSDKSSQRMTVRRDQWQHQVHTQCAHNSVFCIRQWALRLPHEMGHGCKQNMYKTF